MKIPFVRADRIIYKKRGFKSHFFFTSCCRWWNYWLKCRQIRKIAPRIQWYSNISRGFKVEGHSTHLRTSVEREEILVINYPEFISIGLADCFLYFFMTQWLKSNLALLRQSSESSVRCLLSCCYTANWMSYSDNDSLIRTVSKVDTHIS